MPLLTRTEKGSKLTIAEMDGNLEWNNDSTYLMKVLDGALYKMNCRNGAISQQIAKSSSITLRFDYLSSAILAKIGIVEFQDLFPVNQSSIIGVQGAAGLTNIRDEGTDAAFNLRNCNITSSTVIDSLFTQLPTTSLTATIDVAGNSGAAGCDPSIATAKGYTVVTA